ncbi:[protein-PII] uridylyltransferase [Aeromicrobium piscarium]|uniref:Bifunctional uridylyltransferase/uridylyl-removing enzyme n=1 Tax=Aeromicrobium piscarium TaxID=2590901 RepID=A0A554SGJ0_9ACTN|nr:[protein-PII] uridylyltransferase [Aeromicrobium piscarium]TSD65458.1 [protein-PII] uridylyltransferase [Aeromicrobium piscarium]
MSADLAAHLARGRRERSDEADRLLTRVFGEATGTSSHGGLALVAVGGYGRRELSPYSDLDVVLLHDAGVDEAEVARIAQEVWYPLWDRRVVLDHAVRSVDETVRTAGEDYRAAMGMLDARCVVGDAEVVASARTRVLGDWRREARRRIGDVRTARNERIDRFGWLAHAAVPDLKESGGGLRDSVTLRALLATWLVDLPRDEAESLRERLLDIRDTLHEVASRRSDRLLPELVPEVAERWSLGPATLDLQVRDIGRRIAHLASVTWRRVDATVARDPHRRVGARGPLIEPVASGVGVLAGEVVVTRQADPASDPELLLRFAATAARRSLPMNAASIGRLVRQLGDWPPVWPASTRRWMVELLGAGPGLVDVWEELDIAGLIEPLLPEWRDIRLRGSSSPVHRFTIDRHSIETCVQVMRSSREVARPDLLVVAALLHDIGKGRAGDHSEVGAPMAKAICRRWGFDAVESTMVGRLVRWHLLLPTVATRRDIEDPQTAANVAEIVRTSSFLDLLAALTAGDALATSDQAWSRWRRGLVEGLVGKVRAVLAGAPDDDLVSAGWPSGTPLPDLLGVGPTTLAVSTENHHDGSLVLVVCGDRTGVLGDLAGAMSLAGLSIRSVRVASDGAGAATLWEVSRPDLDARVLRERLRAVVDGSVDLARRLTFDPGDTRPRVTVLEAMEQTATLLEVRATDRRALLWVVCRAITAAGYGIRSAHTDTYGDEARDVFYVVDRSSRPLTAEAAESLRTRVTAALTGDR